MFVAVSTLGLLMVGYGFGVLSCATASDVLIGLTAQVNWKPLLVALSSEEEWMAACALPRPVTVVWNDFCPSFRGSRQVHCIASCKPATFRIRGNLYSWSRQVVEVTCHFSDSGRSLNRSSGLQVQCWELGDLSPYFGLFSEEVFWNIESSCFISAGHCSEIQAKVVLLLLVASPWAGALASSAQCGCWVAWLSPHGGLLGWGIVITGCEGSSVALIWASLIFLPLWETLPRLLSMD